MKVLIISDTHGKTEVLRWVLRDEKPIDHLLHLGDVEGSEEKIRELAGCPCDFVAGNCDMFSQLPRTKVVTIGKYQIMMAHGHTMNVTSSEETLVENAKTVGANIAMYGHTHMPSISKKDGVIVINPGSLAYPRQSNRLPSYIVMTLGGSGEASFDIRYYGEKR